MPKDMKIIAIIGDFLVSVAPATWPVGCGETWLSSDELFTASLLLPTTSGSFVTSGSEVAVGLGLGVEVLVGNGFDVDVPVGAGVEVFVGSDV